MAEAYLDRLETESGLTGLQQQLPAALARSADPQAAAARVAATLAAIDAVDAAALRRAWAVAPAPILDILAALAGAAPFLLPLLQRRPDVLFELADDDLGRPRPAGEIAARLALGLAADRAAGIAGGDALRRFKYAELARITVRDLAIDLVPLARTGEVLLEISDLADALLAAALDLAADELATTLGPPEWRFPDGTVRRLPFTVLGLGKLGARELNYSSDVDLIYVYDHPGLDADESETSLEFAAGRDLAPAQYFTRLAQAFGRIVTAGTAEGFLYRIDLDLRPEGSRGPLVISGTAFLSYYDDWAATWERAACLKARPVAGDVDFGWRLIRDLVPVLHRSTMDLQAVAAIKELKERVAEAKARPGEAFNVKLGAGGIRDVESVAQALQLLHGGRIPQLRQRSTQMALEALLDVGLLAAEDAEGLLEAYRFYRRTENRLQMWAERQTHTLPSAAAELARVARSLGFGGDDPAAAFGEAIEARRAFCGRQFARVFPSAGPDRVIALLVRHMPAMLANPVTRGMYEELARQFAAAIDAGVNPERALVNLDRFLEGLRGRRFYVELLLDRPELVRRLAALFATSEYLSTFFAAYPRLIEPIFDDPKTLLLTEAQLRDEFAGIHGESAAPGRDPTEVFLEALRLFHHRQIVNIGLLDIDGKVGRADVEDALTRVAEVSLAYALELAARQLEGRIARPADSAFLVVGMGKLGSRELTYGSDLDVIFLYDLDDPGEYARAMAQEYFARLAQKLIWALSTRVVTGVCYEVDARLRPSGRQGTLVTSIGGFAAYHERGARVWERQALLRARPVTGDPELAARFEHLRRGILTRPFAADPAPEVHRIRRRMEGELARETAARHDFKTGLGGLLDVESVVQLLQMRHGAAHPELLDTDTVTRQLDRLAALELVGGAEHEVLRKGWEFLQRLSSRLRIVDNRSISDLDEERGDLEALALTLGYASTQRSGGARRALLADYLHHTRAIRAVYQSFFPEAA